MPEEWRSILASVLKNKGDIQSCINYQGSKLLSKTMKLRERGREGQAPFEKNLRVIMNQFSFMPGRSTMEAISLIRKIVEQYREQKKDLA